MTDEKKLDTMEETTDAMEENEAMEDSELVEFSDESGKIMKFYHLDTIEYENRFFAFFLPAEEIEGIDPDEVIIYEVSGKPGEEELIPVEDDALLDAVYEEFCNIMDEGCDDEDCECCHHHCEDEE